MGVARVSSGGTEHDGFAIIPDVLDEAAIALLLGSLETCGAGTGDRRRGGIRNLLDVPAVRDLARSEAVRSLVTAVLGSDAFAVRGILFDKTPGANWVVPWHQDLSIAVRERRDVPGFGPWSEKVGVTHVQPPADVLGRMLTVRLHLDACGEDNGPLRVLPGSHREGRLGGEDISRWRERVGEVVCPVSAGGALLMRPLLLHASGEAKTPGHRRVLHLEFAAEDLPGGLEWRDRV